MEPSCRAGGKPGYSVGLPRRFTNRPCGTRQFRPGASGADSRTHSYLHAHVSRSVIHATPKAEAALVPNTWLSTHVPPTQGNVMPPEREGNSDPGAGGGGGDAGGRGTPREGKPVRYERSGILYFHLQTYLEEANSSRQKVERWSPGAPGRGRGEFHEYRVSVLQDEKSSVAGW